MIEIRNVWKRYGDNVILENISSTVKEGEFITLVGASGCGKSTFLRMLLGTDVPSQGEILLDGKPIADEPDAERGVVFQQYSVFPHMTVLENVTIARAFEGSALGFLWGKRKRAAREEAMAMLDTVGLSHMADRYPDELSGGMRQRVVIAMALACKPRLLIADEPTTALDVTIQAEILALMDRLKRETGTAVMFITHDMAVVAQMADRVVVMFRGKKVEEGPVADIFSNPQHDYTKALLAAVPKLGEMTGTDLPEPMRLLGYDPSDVVPIPGTPDPLLEVRNLTTRFAVKRGLLRRTVAQVHAVEDISFTINKGQTLSLVGESGCGKSTAGRSLLRLVEPMSGEVRLDGTDVMALSPTGLRKARLDMQMIFQDPFASLNPQMMLRDQVAEPMRNFATARGKALEDRVAMLFDRVELPRGFMRRYPHELSGGQRQRVAIARALALNPKLIVADEAVSALDVSVQAQVLNLMMELQADLGLSFLFISHDMAVVERVSHRVGVMYLGRIVEIGSRRAVFEDPRHPYTQALLKAVPIADPTRRKIDRDLHFKPIPSPIHDMGYVAAPSVYEQVGEDHQVLVTESGY